MRSLADVVSDMQIKTAGFPVCEDPKCGARDGSAWEATKERKCRHCGGDFPSEEIIHRMLARQLIGCYRDIVLLGPTSLAAPSLRGAAYAIGGIMTQLGFKKTADPIMRELFEEVKHEG